MVSMSKRAGLTVSVTGIRKQIKQQTKSRVSNKGPIHIAAVLEYLVAELLQVSSAAMRARHGKRLHPRDIMLAVRSDPELSELLHDVTFAGSGVPLGTGGIVAKASSDEQSPKKAAAKSSSQASAASSTKGKRASSVGSAKSPKASQSSGGASPKMAWAMGRLSSMGFDETSSQAALAKTKGNVARATSILVK